jgi:hypothetical protein
MGVIEANDLMMLDEIEAIDLFGAAVNPSAALQVRDL